LLGSGGGMRLEAIPVAAEKHWPPWYDARARGLDLDRL
jgi:hypothetical protein